MENANLRRPDEGDIGQREGTESCPKTSSPHARSGACRRRCGRRCLGAAQRTPPGCCPRRWFLLEPAVGPARERRVQRGCSTWRGAGVTVMDALPGGDSVELRLQRARDAVAEAQEAEERAVQESLEAERETPGGGGGVPNIAASTSVTSRPSRSARSMPGSTRPARGRGPHRRGAPRGAGRGRAGRGQCPAGGRGRREGAPREARRRTNGIGAARGSAGQAARGPPAVRGGHRGRPSGGRGGAPPVAPVASDAERMARSAEERVTRGRGGPGPHQQHRQVS